MNDTETEIPKLPELKNVGAIAAVSSIVVILLIILQHNMAFQKTSTIVIPAGGTYLGPTNTPTPMPGAQAQVGNEPVATTKPSETVKNDAANADGTYTTTAGKFAVTDNAVWVTVKGNKYPYSFSFPKALKLVTFPNDQFDIYAISWNNMPPDQNVLIGVDNLSRTDTLKQYITVSKHSYVENWWKQFGLKGVGSILEFTNSKGLKGYRAKFLNSANQSPNEDVFFEVPDPTYVIHIASGILDASVFDKLLDSVAWTK